MHGLNVLLILNRVNFNQVHLPVYGNRRHQLTMIRIDNDNEDRQRYLLQFTGCCCLREVYKNSMRPLRLCIKSLRKRNEFAETPARLQVNFSYFSVGSWMFKSIINDSILSFYGTVIL